MHYEYPFLDKTSESGEFPTGSVCPICKANYQETGFMSLNMCTVQVDENGNGVYFGVDDNAVPLKSDFYICFHDKPLPFPEVRDDCELEYLVMPIVEDFPNNGFEFYFCSIDCLRTWFDRILSDFETLFDKESGKKIPKPHA